MITRLPRLLFMCCLLFAFANMGSAQDAQFSQFYANPLYLNPALTGSHSGSFRIMSSYRSQWNGVLDNPFKTYTAGGDLKFKLRNKSGSFNTGNDLVAVGFQFFSDRVNLYEYNTNNLSFFGAFHKLIGKGSFLSAGVQLGLGQRGVNYEDLTFQDQFDGVDQFDLQTSETLPSNALAYGDMAFGLHLSNQPSIDKGYYFGIAFHHFNKPNISFFNRDSRTADEYEAFFLDSKFTIHGGFSIKKNDFLSIQPRAVYIKQGTASTMIVGTNLKYNFIDSDGIAFHLGGWIRATDNLTTFQPTDLILSTAFQKNGLQIGLSYDLSLRNYSGATLGQNTFELSVSYTGQHNNDGTLCPSF